MHKPALLSVILSILSTSSFAKEIAFSFDDAPFESSLFFESQERSRELIQKLKTLGVPQSAIFANPCKRPDTKGVVSQLKQYVDAGHLIENHTCNHLRLDDAGYDRFIEDAQMGHRLLHPLMGKLKLFRFPTLNEGTNVAIRDKVRGWLKAHDYRNGHVSIDTQDYLFTFSLYRAKMKSQKVQFDELKKLFGEHIVEQAEHFDNVAQKILGRSPKHVILLHEMDVTVLYLEEAIAGLKKAGWKFIPIEEAYQDPVYSEMPKNTYANDGLLNQLALEKLGKKLPNPSKETLGARLDKALGKLP